MWSERRSKLAQLSMTVASPSLSGKSPIDDEFAERTSLRLHVTVTTAGDIAPSATVEDLSSSARAPNLCRFPVKPSGGFHIKLLLESGRESQFSAKWSVSSPMTLGETPTSAVAKADIYINTRILCQAILRKSQIKHSNFPPAHATIAMLNFYSQQIALKAR